MSIKYGHFELRDSHMARRAEQGPMATPQSEALIQLAESSEPGTFQPVEYLEPVKRPAGRPKGSLGRRHLEAKDIVTRWE
jgi:hypothetical protein